MGLARRIGHGIFYLIMAVCLIGGVGMGLAEAKDALDRQPIIWGTYAEEACEPRAHGCESIGRWVSDDGVIVKERIRPDGVPGTDGTVRAGFQPVGLTNDNETNVVHSGIWVSGGLWLPWVLSVTCLGYTIHYARKWRRQQSRRSTALRG